MTSPFIVIGTGISALGAIEALIEKGHKPLVVDIGLIPKITKIELESNRIPCAKSWKGSYQGYGLVDNQKPFSIKSKRLCSSHQYGGYSSLWTGSCHPTSKDDLKKILIHTHI